MTFSSLKDLWRYHCQNLHQKENYLLNSPALCISYFSSGVEFKGKEALLKQFISLPVSPLNFEAFQISPLNTIFQESSDDFHSGMVIEEALFSWRPAAADLKVDDHQSAKVIQPKRRLEGSHMDAFFQIFFSGWAPADITPQAFTKLNLLIVPLFNDILLIHIVLVFLLQVQQWKN
jgi:hypothetical protein